MTIFLIKTALLRFGVVISEVKFDVDGENIVVNYSLHGVRQTKIVAFSEIERLFNASQNAPEPPDPRDVGH
jgi:hypothetical protein